MKVKRLWFAPHGVTGTHNMLLHIRNCYRTFSTTYNSYVTYLQKCRQVRLLPLVKRFDFNDFVLFYKVIHNILPLQLPYYLKFYEGTSRLRSCHLDHLSIVSSLHPKTNVISNTNKNCALNKSFFYRVHLQWNKLPIEIRNIENLSKFKVEILKYLWDLISPKINDTAVDEEDMYDIE